MRTILLSVPVLAFLVLGLGVAAWFSARARAAAFAGAGKPRPHSLPSYHGWYVALWAVVPALLFLTAWTPLSSGLVMQSVTESPAAANLPPLEMQRNAIFNEARERAEPSLLAAFNR